MTLGSGRSIKHHLFRLKYTELNEIYWFMALRSFAISLVAIFIPVYLYKIDYGISNIFLYYLALYFFEFIFEYIAARYMKLKGPKHSMILSLPFMILFICLLFSIEAHHWAPVILALPLSLSLSLFWEGYHYDFSRSKHTARATKEIGKVYILLTIIGATAPLIGGILATYFGINILLLIVIALLSIGSIILFKTKDNNFRKGSLNLTKVDLSHINKHILSYVGLGWETVSAMQVWPLFVFLIVGSYSTLGLITSATLVVSVFVTYWVSHRADKGKRTDYIKTGGFLGAFVGILQVFVQTITQAFAVNLGRSFAQSIFKSSFDSEYYLHADEESRSEYIYLMESAVDLSRFLFYLVMYVMSLYFSLPVVLVTGLLMGAFGSLLVPFMPAAECEVCGEIKNKQIKVSRRMNA
jgi:MFS family permease